MVRLFTGFIGVVCAVVIWIRAVTSLLWLPGSRRVGDAVWARFPCLSLLQEVGVGMSVWDGVHVTSTHGPWCMFLCDMGL